VDHTTSTVASPPPSGRAGQAGQAGHAAHAGQTGHAGQADGDKQQPRRLPRRLSQLYVGLFLYGVSDAMLVLAGLGLDPWDVFHQGLSRTFGLGIGTWSIIVGAAVLLLWIPLRQRPGLGTLSNVLAVGGTVNLVLAAVPAPHLMIVRIAVLVSAVALNGVATAFYIGAGLGPGPRDGLMTGLGSRGHSIRFVRTVIELTVLVIGFVMGGTVGVGTVLYAVSIGPIAHVLLPRLKVQLPAK
jgi:uncharacterized membrane protein YczE